MALCHVLLYLELLYQNKSFPKIVLVETRRKIDPNYINLSEIIIAYMDFINPFRNPVDAIAPIKKFN